MTPLEEAILAAAEAGDYQLLRQLQARYRQSAVITSSARGQPWP